MQKILLGLEGEGFNPDILNFPSFLSKSAHSKIMGVFLDGLDGASDPDFPKDPLSVESNRSKVPYYRNRHPSIQDHYAEFFLELCKKMGILAKLPPGITLDREGLLRETRYSDLLILDHASFRDDLEGTHRNQALVNLIGSSECPVLIMQDKLFRLEEVFFSFDGSPGSVGAIKQFTCQFHQFSEKKVTVVQSDLKPGVSRTEKAALMEWLNIHYSNAYFQDAGKASLSEFLRLREPEKLQALVICRNPLPTKNPEGAGLLDYIRTSPFSLYLAPWCIPPDRFD